MNILIADNDLVELRRLYLLLQTATDPRPTLFVATTPAQAAAYARTERIDVVFTEIFPGEPDAFGPIRALQARHPAVNIIIVSGSADYAFPAWQLHASDYLLKPVDAGAVRAALDNLRYPVPEKPAPEKLTVQCFGNFEIFFRGEVIHFDRSGAKEVLAYLISRRGASVTVSELCRVLWEDEGNATQKKSYVRTYFTVLKRTLEALGLGDVLRHTRNAYAVNPALLDCDYYRYLEQPLAAKRGHQA